MIPVEECCSQYYLKARPLRWIFQSWNLACISCIVKNLLVKEGDYVSVGQPLVSVTQNRKLFLRADVSEKYYPYLNSIGSANFRTPYNNKVYTLKELGGRMLSYGKACLKV